MALKQILLALLLQQAPPGVTKYSVVAADCAPEAAECPGAVRSTFHHGWVRRETVDEAKARYALVSSALVDAATELLCLGPDGKPLDGCKPADGARFRGRTGGKLRWRLTDLVMTGAAGMIYESGLREDIMNGRGRAKHPSDDGGEGRGPSNEACFMQIHPAIAWRFADVPDDLRARAARGEPGAREAVMQTLLGGSPEAMRNCFRAGLRMLMRARAHCEWQESRSKKPAPMHWTFLTFAMYGTGQSCYAHNGSKTSVRAALAEQLIAKADGLRRAEASGR